jgi:putative Mn2+ efflux pump MntP
VDGQETVFHWISSALAGQLFFTFMKNLIPSSEKYLGFSLCINMELGIQFWVQFLKKMNTGFVVKIRPHSSLILTNLDRN